MYAGGTYGYVRVTMGIYLGYIIGCCELVSYLVLSATTYLYFGSTMTVIAGTSPLLEPMWWCVFCVLLVAPMLHNKYFWHINALLGIITIACVVLFLFTLCVISPSYPKYAHSSDVHYFEGGLEGFLTAFGPASLMYLGIEICPLMAEDVSEVRMHYDQAMLRI